MWRRESNGWYRFVTTGPKSRNSIRTMTPAKRCHGDRPLGGESWMVRRGSNPHITLPITVQVTVRLEPHQTSVANGHGSLYVLLPGEPPLHKQPTECCVDLFQGGRVNQKPPLQRRGDGVRLLCPHTGTVRTLWTYVSHGGLVCIGRASSP